MTWRRVGLLSQEHPHGSLVFVGDFVLKALEAVEALPRVTAASLLIGGSLDHVVLDLNRSAQAKLHCENKLVTVDGATHLFQEPSKLSYVAQQAGSWCIEEVHGMKTTRSVLNPNWLGE